MAQSAVRKFLPPVDPAPGVKIPEPDNKVLTLALQVRFGECLRIVCLYVQQCFCHASRRCHPSTLLRTHPITFIHSPCQSPRPPLPFRCCCTHLFEYAAAGAFVRSRQAETVVPRLTVVKRGGALHDPMPDKGGRTPSVTMRLASTIMPRRTVSDLTVANDSLTEVVFQARSWCLCVCCVCVGE